MPDIRTLPASPATGPAAVPDVDPRLVGDRLGRLCAGATLIFGAIVTVGLSLADGSPRAALLVSWATAAVAFVVGRAVGRRLRVEPGLVRRSLCVPVVGISLTAPLTMHAVLSFLIGASSDDFRAWVLFSMALTAQSHIVLAALASSAALRHLQGRAAASTPQILVACVLSAALPVGMFAAGEFSDIVGLAIIAVALQILVLGPIFMVPMMRMSRAAARQERVALT